MMLPVSNDKEFERITYSSETAPFSGKEVNTALEKALKKGSTFLLLLNEQTALNADQLAKAAAAAEHAQADIAALALRVLPYGPDFHCNPVTLEADRLGTDGILLNCTAVKKVGGFDNSLTGKAAIADLCWRLRGAGYRLLYTPDLIATTQKNIDAAENLTGYITRISSHCRLLARYKSKAEALQFLLNTFKKPCHFDGVRKTLLQAAPGVVARILLTGKAPEKAAAFSDLSESYGPAMGVCPVLPLPRQPLVSVVIRTCSRPDTLRETLKCLYHQTYKNFEIVIVEDGKPTAQKMVCEEFADLPIRYHATINNVGRGRAGNLGIELARGEFVSFLDDDDFYYPDFIEQHVGRLLAQPEQGFVLSSIMAFEVDVTSRSPYIFSIKKRYPVIFDHITLMDMCIKCRVPMTGGMFARRLYDIAGGMREDLDGDEDWAMWLGFWKTCGRSAVQADIPRAVSMFGYPADPAKAAARLATYEIFDEQMLSDPGLVFTCTGEQLRYFAKTAKSDFAHLKKLGQLSVLQLDKHFAAPLPFDPDADTNPRKEYTVTAQQLNRWYYALASEEQV